MKKQILTILGICAVVIAILLASKATPYRPSKPGTQDLVATSSLPFGTASPSLGESAATSSIRLYAWGENDEGQSGPANKDGATLTEKPVSIAAGKSHTLILRKDGTVVSFGDNDEGQLGRPTESVFDAVPAQIPNLSDVIQIAAKGNYSLALAKDGTVWSWGSNFTGALGTGDNTDRSIPTQINGLTGVTTIAAGNKFALAIKDDGTVWGWGASCNEESRNKANDILSKAGSVAKINGGYYDPSNRGGNYDRSEDCLNEDVVGIKSTSPRQLSSTLTGATQISAGYGHALILKKDGTVWSFGCNLYGQLGAKNFDNIKDNSVPRKISFPSSPGITSISAGFRHSLALTDKGEIYVWGISSAEDLTGNTFNASTPVPLKIPGNISRIYDGHDYSLAVDSKGGLWAWGMDNHNLFQSGAPQFYSTPKLI